jgi:hypothetical protein
MSLESFTDISLVKKRRLPRSTCRPNTISTGTTRLCYMYGTEPIIYDNRTMNYYKTARQCHIDPILNMEVDEKIAFKFKYQWDPYTGDRSGIDPYGSLYFHPMSLVYNYYIHRLDGLWKSEVDSAEGMYEGYYDMLVGTGNELEVIGRDKYTELYLFRLPILDCYLTPDHNKSFITMGPKLNDQEIDEINKLCQNKEVQDEFVCNFSRRCPSLKTMKLLYDNAIAKEVVLPESCRKQYIIPQHYYVDQLRLI